MSTTNRAFIKAYRQDAAQPNAETLAAVRIDDPQSRVVRGSHDPAHIATEGLQNAGARRPPVGGCAASGDPRTTLEKAPQASVAVQGVVERRPLSSYITRHAERGQAHFAPKTPHDHRGDGARPVSQEIHDSDNNTLEPGTTVASFQWPAVCRTLLQQNGSELDNVVRLLLSRARSGNSLVGVLGLFSRVGATTTALCLAARAAGRGQRVVLADCNFLRPRVASLLEVVPTAGWEDFLKHSAPLADAVIRATADSLDVLALGTRPVKEPERLASGLHVAVTAGLLRHAYDLVLLDLGTFFDPATQPSVLELTINMGVDAVVGVMGPEPADPRDVATIVEHLDRGSCEFLGIIENRVAKPKAA